MAESSNWSCSIYSDDYSFLSGSVNYSIESSSDLSICNLSVSAEVEVLPYHFKPITSDSESICDVGKVAHGGLDSFNPERVGKTDS